MSSRSPAYVFSANQGSEINLLAILAFVVALGLGLIVRMFIPDEVMTRAGVTFSPAESAIAVALAFMFLGWISVYFRYPWRPAIALFGAALSALVAGLMTFDMVRAAQWSLLPGVTIFWSFSLMTLAHWLWLHRSSRAPQAAPPQG